MDTIQRLLDLPERSFFLLGPRGVGKSTWMHQRIPDAFFIDLLKSSVYFELSRSSDRLEGLISAVPEHRWIVIDEIQKLPELLDEVHRLIENKQYRFVLCGSSARKLRRAGVNLLGGRALTRDLEQFSAAELGTAFDLNYSLRWGMMPYVQVDKSSPADVLDAYVNTYMREEIKEEGFIRRIQSFSRFLAIAGQLNGRILNLQNVSREASVPRSTIDVYFSILEETLLAHFLSPFRPGARLRETAHKKFYFFDPGVARAAAGLLYESPDRLWLGFALETLVYHELRVYNKIRSLHKSIYYYSTPGEVEIDFVIETKKQRQGEASRIICIEVKLADSWNRSWEHPSHALAKSTNVVVEKIIGIYTGSDEYLFEDAHIMPYNVFVNKLYAGEIF
jgi:uncharacterized protein